MMDKGYAMWKGKFLKDMTKALKAVKPLAQVKYMVSRKTYDTLVKNNCCPKNVVPEDYL